MPRLPFRERLQSVPNTDPNPLPAIYGRDPPPFTQAQIRAIQVGNPKREFERVAIDNYREVSLARTCILDPRRRRSLESLPSVASRWGLPADEGCLASVPDQSETRQRRRSDADPPKRIGVRFLMEFQDCPSSRDPAHRTDPNVFNAGRRPILARTDQVFGREAEIPETSTLNPHTPNVLALADMADDALGSADTTGALPPNPSILHPTATISGFQTVAATAEILLDVPPAPLPHNAEVQTSVTPGLATVGGLAGVPPQPPPGPQPTPLALPAHHELGVDHRIGPAPPPEDPEGNESDEDGVERHREIFVMLTPPSEVARLRIREEEIGGHLELFDVPGDDRTLAIFAETDEDWADVHSVSITRVLPQRFIWKLVVLAFHFSPAVFVALTSASSAVFGALLYRAYLSYDPYYLISCLRNFLYRQMQIILEAVLEYLEQFRDLDAARRNAQG